MKKDGRMYRIIKKWLESKDSKSVCPFYYFNLRKKYCCNICAHFFPRTKKALDNLGIGKGKSCHNWIYLFELTWWGTEEEFQAMPPCPCPCTKYFPGYVRRRVRKILESAHVG